MNLLYSKILVTGGGGWLGSYFLRALSEGLENFDSNLGGLKGLPVRVLIRHQEAIPSDLLLKNPHWEIMKGDIRDREFVKKFCHDAEHSLLIHTAGVIHPRRSKDFLKINFEGSKILIEESEACSIKRAIIVSSNSPLGCNPHRDHRFDEKSPFNPYMGYGYSKMLLEQEVHRLVGRGEVEAVIIRPPWFYGPYQPPRQTLFFKMIEEGKVPVVGSGENLRSMCYLDNLIQGLLLASIKEKASGQTYWIADERPYSMNEIIGTIERLLQSEFNRKCKGTRLRAPHFVGEMATVMDKAIQSCGLYHQKIHVLSEMNKTIACSIEKAKEELGYIPHISLEEGMRRSIRYCMQMNSMENSQT